MAMKLKLNLEPVKNFFLHAGEKLGLVVCLGAMAALVGFGVQSGLGAKFVPGTKATYAQELDTIAKKHNSALAQGKNLDAPKLPEAPNGGAWPHVVSGPNSRYWDYVEGGSNKRLNPRTLPLLASSERNEIVVNYIRGSYFAFDVEHAKKQIRVLKEKDAIGSNIPALKGKGMAQKKTAMPSIVTRPVHMVTVHAVVPIQEQLLEFQRAFRYPTLAEAVKNKEDLPKYLGINVWKTEIVSGQAPDWKPLILGDPKSDKLTVSDGIRKVMREAILDDLSLAYQGPFLMQGLSMAFPKLAILPETGYHYPDVSKLRGIDKFDWDNAPAMAGGAGAGMAMPKAGGAMPAVGMAGGAMAGAGPAQDPTKFEAWNAVKGSPEIYEKLTDATYLLDPTLVNFDPDAPKVGGPGLGPIPMVFPGGGLGMSPYVAGSNFAALKFWERYPLPQPAGMTAPGKTGAVPVVPGGAATASLKPWDALVRFFDPDVKPGKTYQYMIQLRLANPNYGKKTEVAFAALAEPRELPPSPPVETPTITIPEQYFLYAIDQKPESKVKEGTGPDVKDAKPDQVAIQIHRWVDETIDSANIRHVVGDWAIAERLLVRRGFPIGRSINVEAPVWNRDTQKFEVGMYLESGKPVAAPKVKKDDKKPAVPMKESLFGPTTMVAPVATATGIPVDFAATNPPPVLADFEGGKREMKFGGTILKDESAATLLILNSDGRLVVRSQREDSDDSSEAFAERQRRMNDVRTRLNAIAETPTGNPGGPGVPPRPKAPAGGGG